MKRCKCSCKKSYAREKAKACSWSKPKFEHCVMGVKQSNRKYHRSANPWAVCNSQCI